MLTSPLAPRAADGGRDRPRPGAVLRVEASLAPGATAAALDRALEGEQGPVATVGHQPDCSEIALALIGRDPGFPVAGMVGAGARSA